MSSGSDEWDDRKARDALLHRARIETLKESFRGYYRDAVEEAIYERMFRQWLDPTNSRRRSPR